MTDHAGELAAERAETERLREALDLIAKGHLSPCLDFAQAVLDGADPKAALSAIIASRREGTRVSRPDRSAVATLTAALTSATSGERVRVDRWSSATRNAAAKALRVRGWRFEAGHENGHAYMCVVVVGS